MSSVPSMALQKKRGTGGPRGSLVKSRQIICCPAPLPLVKSGMCQAVCCKGFSHYEVPLSDSLFNITVAVSQRGARLLECDYEVSLEQLLIILLNVWP